VLVPLRPEDGGNFLSDLIVLFCDGDPIPNTSKDYRQALEKVFRMSGQTHPEMLTEAHIVSFCVSDAAANDTVYQRLSQIRTFLRWCEVAGIARNHSAEGLAQHDSPRRTYRRTYGKAQSARFLTREEAFGQLVGDLSGGDDRKST
jgi:hypothetical protein